MAYITTDINTDNATDLLNTSAYMTPYTLYDTGVQHPYVPFYASGTDTYSFADDVIVNEDFINDFMDHVSSCLPVDNDLRDESDIQDNVPSAELETFLENFKIIEDEEVA